MVYEHSKEYGWEAAGVVSLIWKGQHGLLGSVGRIAMAS
jgi:hypothetical protein